MARTSISGGLAKSLIWSRSFLLMFYTFFWAGFKAGKAFSRSFSTIVFFYRICTYFSSSLTFKVELSTCFSLALVFYCTIIVIFWLASFSLASSSVFLASRLPCISKTWVYVCFNLSRPTFKWNCWSSSKDFFSLNNSTKCLMKSRKSLGAWCDVVELLGWFGKFLIQLDDSTMNSNNNINNNVVSLLILLNGSLKRLNNRVNNRSELFSNPEDLPLTNLQTNR